MNDNQRLSRIVTLWSVVRDAHGDDSAASSRALAELLQQYGPAVRRYLSACLSDSDAVDEVFQDFSLRFVRGDFASASPDKGHFRRYLKTVVFHLVADFGRARKRHRAVAIEHESLLQDDSDEEVGSNLDAEFSNSWRDHLLSACWELLRQEEERTGRLLFTPLRLRSERPDLDSEGLAAEVSAMVGRDVSSGNVRVCIHRARERFARLLLDAVRNSLARDDQEELHAELVDLRLWQYCRPVLERESDGN